MKTSTASVVFPCSIATFWATYLDDTYTRALYLDEFRYKDFTVLARADTPTDTSRRMLIIPRLNLPGPLAKLIGDSFAYELRGALDREANVWTWRMEQPEKVGGKAKKGMVSTRGTVRVAATPDGQCRRTDECVIESGIFGLGGLIEATAEKELRAAWATEFAFLARWIGSHRP